ncbi:flagellar filament capping protein FliD [Planococcus lenghuensis]|nr:flagellar filament capping protein FliD [Planococcus lenghuensis]
MDTDSIVKEMMQVRKLPLDKLMQEKTWTEWQQESYRESNLALSGLRDLASNLRLQRTFNAYSATTLAGNVTVSPTANAMSGSYEVNVHSVAKAAKMHSAAGVQNSTGSAAKSTDKIGVAGTITISGTATAVDITETMSFADVAKKLQDATAGSVPALRVNFDDTTSSFFISTKEMGAAQNFSLDFSSQALADKIINKPGLTSFSTADTALTNTSTATNGKVTFEGIVIDNLTSNKTTINGLALTLEKIGADTITVKSDATKPFEAIKSFVEKYNETIEAIEKKLVEKRYRDFQPLSDEQKKDMSETEIELWQEKSKSGLLRNDPILKSALQDLRRAFMDPVSSLATGSINTLAEIGISTGDYREGGKLFINEDKLKKALTDKPDEVMQLFSTNAGGGGIGQRVYGELNDTVKRLSERAGNPSYTVDNSTISKRLRQMDEEITRWQDRLGKIEDRYWRQFTAMEKALSQMNSQSTWMQQNMFGGM